MLLRNKEGNCIRDVKNSSKIASLKAMGFVEAKAGTRKPADKKAEEARKAEVKEDANGGISVTL